MTGRAYVAARVTGLALDHSGHLPDDDYASMAVRGGLLVDLALAQRLSQGDDSIDLDENPTGWPPADRALSELGLLDGRTLDWWLAHSRVGLDELAAALVADGSWDRLPARPLHRRARYRIRDEETLGRDRALLTTPHSTADATDAAVVAIAVAAGLAGRQAASRDAGRQLRRAEPAAWICELVVDFLRRARIDGTAVSSASQTALWSGMPY